jgi:Cys-rich four helix bundle protein (predicted Tat secretion target)
METSRRMLVKAPAALIAMGMVATARAADDDHKHHDHHGAAAPHAALAAAAADCLVTGDACLAHCLVLLGQGDTSIAGCAASVNQMLAVCGALQKLAAQQSKLTPAMARVALDACVACEKECRKHADKHAECRACAQSCVTCIEQCRKAAA